MTERRSSKELLDRLKSVSQGGIDFDCEITEHTRKELVLAEDVCGDAIVEIERLQRENERLKIWVGKELARPALEPPAAHEPRPFIEWAADIRTQSLQRTTQAYKAKIQQLEYQLACSAQPPSALSKTALLDICALVQEGSMAPEQAADQILSLVQPPLLDLQAAIDALDCAKDCLTVGAMRTRVIDALLTLGKLVPAQTKFPVTGDGNG